MKRPFLFAFITLIIIACGSDDEAVLPQFESGQYIKTGIACGLCAGICQDTLIITPNKLFYKGVRYTQTISTFIRNAEYTPTEWEALIGLLEPDSLNGINLESCSRCVDGCDLYYDIQAGGVSNNLSIVWNDTLPGNLKFQQAVDSLRAEFQQ